MNAQSTGFDHVLLGRPRRLDRHGILAFLRSVALDRRGMLELRRLLADDLGRSSIHNLRDDVVIEQLADRYLRGAISVVLLRPREVEVPAFFVEGAELLPLTGPTNELADEKPTPEIPPEYPRLARVEADQIIDSTKKLVAKLAALLFGGFGLDKRPSTLGRELLLVATEQGVNIGRAGRALDVTLALELHPQGSAILPDPQVKDAYIAAAREIAPGPPGSVSFLIGALFPLARVDTDKGRVDFERGEVRDPKAPDAPPEEAADEAEETRERWMFSM